MLHINCWRIFRHYYHKSLFGGAPAFSPLYYVSFGGISFSWQLEFDKLCFLVNPVTDTACNFKSSAQHFISVGCKPTSSAQCLGVGCAGVPRGCSALECHHTTYEIYSVLFKLWVTKSWATRGAVWFSDLQLRFSAVFLFCYLWVGHPQDSQSPGSVCLHPLPKNFSWISFLWHQFELRKWIRAVPACGACFHFLTFFPWIFFFLEDLKPPKL